MTVITILALGALACFATASALAIASFRFESLRDTRYLFGLSLLGLLLKTAAIGVYCVNSDSHYFNSPSEIVGLLGWALSFSFLVALSIYSTRSLGAVILPFVTVLLALSHVLTSDAVPVTPPPAGLLAPHILAAFLGYGLLLTACGAALLYMEQNRMLKRKVFGMFFRELPSLERCEKLQIVCSRMGVFIFTFAIITGAIMARKLNRPFWTDPKVLAAEATWLVFLILVVGRALNWLHGRRSARFILIGTVLVVCTFALSHPITRINADGTTDPRATSPKVVREAGSL